MTNTPGTNTVTNTPIEELRERQRVAAPFLRPPAQSRQRPINPHADALHQQIYGTAHATYVASTVEASPTVTYAAPVAAPAAPSRAPQVNPFDLPNPFDVAVVETPAPVVRTTFGTQPAVAIAAKPAPKRFTRADIIGTTTVIIGLWLVAIALATNIDVDWPIRRAMIFVHVVGTVIGFGAVLVADVHGALWMMGRRRREDLIRLMDGLNNLIWGGLFVLCVSGVFLAPNLDLPRTSLKIVCVLIATINGYWAHRLAHQLRDQEGSSAADIDQRLLIKTMIAGGISQFAWWTCVIVGFLNSSAK